jgi:hypothetical protein
LHQHFTAIAALPGNGVAGRPHLVQTLAVGDGVGVFAPLDVKEEQSFLEVDIPALFQEIRNVILFFIRQRQSQENADLSHLLASVEEVLHQFDAVPLVLVASDVTQGVADQSVCDQDRQVELNVF